MFEFTLSDYIIEDITLEKPEDYYIVRLNQSTVAFHFNTHVVQKPIDWSIIFSGYNTYDEKENSKAYYSIPGPQEMPLQGDDISQTLPPMKLNGTLGCSLHISPIMKSFKLLPIDFQNLITEFMESKAPKKTRFFLEEDDIIIDTLSECLKRNIDFSTGNDGGSMNAEYYISDYCDSQCYFKIFPPKSFFMRDCLSMLSTNDLDISGHIDILNTKEITECLEDIIEKETEEIQKRTVTDVDIESTGEDYDEGFGELEESIKKHKRRLYY